MSKHNKRINLKEGTKPIRSGRDISLPATIMTYKEKLAGSFTTTWNQNKRSTDTSTTADSTISTRDKTKIIDLDTKISEITETQLQTTTDYQDLRNQQAKDKKHCKEDMKVLTAQISKLRQTIGRQHEENK